MASDFDPSDLLRNFNIFKPIELLRPGGEPSPLGTPPIFNPSMTKPDIPLFQAPHVQASNIPTPDDTFNFTPETGMQDLYTKTIGEQPVREKPGFWRHIRAGLAGWGDPSVASATLNAPYNRAMADWKAKLDAIQPAMTAERYGNINARTIATEAERNRIREEQIRQTAETARAREERLNRLGQAKLDIQKYKLDHPDWDIVKIPGGNVMLVSPRPEDKPVDTGLPSGELDDLTLENLRTSRALSVARETGAQQRQTEEVRQVGRTELERQRQEGRETLEDQRQVGRQELADVAGWTKPEQTYDKDGKPLGYLISTNKATGEIRQVPLPKDAVTRTVPPGSGGSAAKSQSQADIAKGRVNQANKAISEHPEWEKYITIDAKGNVTVGMPIGAAFGRGTREEMNRVNNFIFGTPVSTSTTTTPAPGNVPQPPKPAAQYQLPPPKESGKVGTDGSPLVEVYSTQMKQRVLIPKAAYTPDRVGPGKEFTP